MANATAQHRAAPAISVPDSVDSKRPSSVDTPSATAKPMNIASPPRAGIGAVCTVRSLGSYTSPTLRQNLRTSGTVAAVTPKATASTTT